MFKEIITQNKEMLNLFKYCEAVANSTQPVLITGETGVGKELFARAIHRLSNRNKELVAINIAGFDDNMLSDTLFGHSKGAFTGATEARAGMIERASGGTLFLDEIGDLNAQSQVKLLRLLQEKEYTPLGLDSTKHSDARLLFATHQKINELQANDQFRKDLYYRISIHHIHIPALRDRKDDLVILLDYFLHKISNEFGKKIPSYHPELITLLKSYHFPGNIRELQSMVYDAIGSHQSKMLSTKIFKQHICRNSPGLNENNSSIDCSEEWWFEKTQTLPTLKEATRRFN